MLGTCSGIVLMESKLHLIGRTGTLVTLDRTIVLEGGGNGHVDGGFVGTFDGDDAMADGLTAPTILHHGTAEVTQTTAQLLMSARHTMQGDAFGSIVETAVLLRGGHGGRETELAGTRGCQMKDDDAVGKRREALATEVHIVDIIFDHRQSAVEVE